MTFGAFAQFGNRDDNVYAPILPPHGQLVDQEAFVNFITQTIALASGSNYCSFAVEITLDELKAALKTAFPGTVITIKTKTKTTSYNPDRDRWSGSITDFNLGNMTIISVANAGEFTLQGMPVNPADHPITIKAGSNYLAFPLDVNMTPTQAFAGFAVNGDKLKSKGVTCPFNRGIWGNQIPNLEPGKGYIYVGKAGEADRTFVFPTSSK
jgi:hypothetical protein